MAADKAANEARMSAIFGKRRLQSATPKPKAKPRTVDPPPGLREGRMGWLDEKQQKAWEGTLSKAEQERWQSITEALAEAGPEMRWRVAGWVMRSELEHARKCYRIAKNLDNEPYKADLIIKNGQKFRELVELLEGRLAGMYDLLVPLGSLIGDVETAHHMLHRGYMSLHRASSHWNDSWPGAARGRGITGYDTPEGVERVRQEVRDAHERYQSGEAKKARERQEKEAKRGRKGKRRNKFGASEDQVDLT